MIEREEKIQYLKEVIDIFDANDIWYSLDNETLRGVYQFKDLIPNEEKLSLMIATDGYQKLLRLFPNRMLDSSLDSSFKSVSPCFVKDNKNWKNEQEFVELRILIPSTEELINKYESLTNRIKNKLKARPINTKTSINDLKSDKFDGYYLLSDNYVEMEKRWIQVLSMERVELPFNNIKVKVIKEYEKVVKNWWKHIDFNKTVGVIGVNKKYYYEYPYPGKRIKGELKGKIKDDL